MYPERRVGTEYGDFTRAETIRDFVPQWRELYSGIAFCAGRVKVPHVEFWALRIDLRDENIEIIVNDTGAEDGYIPALTVSGFAAAYDCIAAMNAGPFSPVSAKTGEGRFLTGVFISSGRLVTPPDPRYDSLVIYDDGRAAALSQREIPIARLRHAIGGFYTILDDGNLTERVKQNKKRHPRSAAAVSDGGFTLYLLVIDGRRPGSSGATEMETGLLLRALGAEDGILMDGGGSSALAVNIGGKIRLVNKPVHGGIIGMERAVASCIGVRLTTGRRKVLPP
jgi:exopolysaccharide biosynthesis protein